MDTQSCSKENIFKLNSDSLLVPITAPLAVPTRHIIFGADLSPPWRLRRVGNRVEVKFVFFCIHRPPIRFPARSTGLRAAPLRPLRVHVEPKGLKCPLFALRVFKWGPRQYAPREENKAMGLSVSHPQKKNKGGRNTPQSTTFADPCDYANSNVHEYGKYASGDSGQFYSLKNKQSKAITVRGPEVCLLQERQHHE